MKCLSQVFQPIISIPKNAIIKSTDITCKSQKLLLECGLVRPTGPGLVALLPLATRALHKLAGLARAALQAAGAQEVALPALCRASLWRRSGRLEGSELIRLTDRHGKHYVLAPTHEESIADLLADVGPLSYKQLPLILYQISHKYRDEARPKHGLLRARHFLMLDAYGAHADPLCAGAAYTRVGQAYTGLFHQLQLPVHRVSAESGAMGGSLSHEWQLCAEAGEDALLVCASCSHAALAPPGASETTSCAQCGAAVQPTPSIEVGHTFMLGSKYAEALGAACIPPEGTTQPLLMTCYGIGLTRLLGAALEALSSAEALRWPPQLAPYHTLLIGPKEGSKEWSACERQVRAAHDAVTSAGRDVIVDDRHHLSIGKRLLQAHKMGYPHVVVAGRAAAQETPRFELHRAGARPGDLNPLLVTLGQLADPLYPPCESHQSHQSHQSTRDPTLEPKIAV